MVNSNEYVAAMQDQLRKWDAQVDLLVEANKKANAAEAGRYQAHLKLLRETRDAGQIAFKELRMAGDTPAAQFQESMDKAWRAMDTMLVAATRELQS
ncbi:MAG TPA: hypothetical protein VFV17_06000 [Usitatibacteraceae bacterium]|nr:hypothetical protein [Usitatibacteraceae bacterium]